MLTPKRLREVKQQLDQWCERGWLVTRCRHYQDWVLRLPRSVRLWRRQCNAIVAGLLPPLPRSFHEANHFEENTF